MMEILSAPLDLDRALEARQLRAPRGSTLQCKGWLQEAALRMFCNNLDPEVADGTDSWVPTVGWAYPRRYHAAVWTGAEMIVWGGERLDPPAPASLLPTGGRYTPATDAWTPTPTGPSAPSRRQGHTAVWTGTEMIVWGGGSPLTETGGRYDPSTDTWTATTIGAGVPSARFLHTGAVWTGTEMIVWGGDPHTATGGRYCVSDCTTPGNWFQDGDVDGYGIASVMVPACAQPPGFVAASGDCNDANSSIHPGVTETCNGLDDDCSGVVDDGIPAPGGRPPVNAALAGTIVTLSWPAVPGATGYDAVTGGLGDLRGSGGDFTSSTTGCLGNDLPDTTVNDVTGPPASGPAAGPG